MKNNMSPHENRREHIRVSANLYFCVSIIEGVDPDTNNFIYGDCFCTKSTNISLGGVSITHRGNINVGFEMELSVPQNMTREKCLACEKSFFAQ